MLPTYVGRYKICNEIDRGSFATVVLAWDEELESSVALKILNVSDSAIEKRFLAEARMLRRVRAPNVITVHDIGRLNDGRPYFVLDYADRGTLADRIPHPTQLLSLASSEPNHLAELQALLLLVDALADGLSAIHSVGLIHRDIKPSNLFFESIRRAAAQQSTERGSPAKLIIAADERALVGDLGIAKDLNSDNAQATMIGGTPLFLAPEQLDPDASIASTADIYAASAVLWSVLTGSQPPMPDRLESSLEGMPDSWQSILATGLARNPDKRFQSMDEWRWAIHDIVGNAGRTLMIEPTSPSLKAELCPYKGLAAYQPEDAEKFCGREALIDELLHRLQLHNVLVVGGPSGSCKSSLVRAGLIPALKVGSLPGSESWQVHLLTPGNDPMTRLTAVAAQDANCLYVFDQFEEVFTLAEDNQRVEFLESLATLANQRDDRCKIVIVIRADFYAECAREAWLASRISNNQVLVGPMTENELRQAISEPARRSGYFLERGLMEAILEQAGNEPGALPLVAHSLVETWVRRDGNTLTLEGFLAAGGVVGAISQTADAAYEHQLDDLGREQTRQLMLRLVVASNAGTPDTRRILSREEIDSASASQVIDRSVIQVLTEARLLSIDGESIQIAHEALLHRWPRLHRWIEESRDDLRVRHKISHSAQEWQSEGNDADFLYRGTPLLAATDWLTHNPGLLSPLEQTFLDTSLKKSNERQAAENARSQRVRRVRRNALVALTVLAIGTSVSSVVAYMAFRDSQRNAVVADVATKAAESKFAIALGAAAYGHVEEDPRLSLVLAAESMAMSAPAAAPFDTRAAMVSARTTLQQGGPFLFGGPYVASNALAIALNPQGSILVIGSIDGSLDFIGTANRVKIQPAVKDHEGGIRDISFSPDGLSIVTASTDGTLRIWKLDDADQWVSSLLASSSDVIVDVDFMPDGKSVISANDVGTVQRYFIDGRINQPPPIAVSSFGFNSVGISKDGKYVLAANADKFITGYVIETGELVLGPLKPPSASHMNEFSFSVDGKYFATVDTDGVANVFEFPSGELRDDRFEVSGRIGILFFHPDGRRLFGGDESGTLIQWSAATGELQKRSATGHSQILTASSISADGSILVTLGRDQIIRFWTLDDSFPMARAWDAPGGAAKGVSISFDGDRLATADKSGLVQLRRIDNNDKPQNLRGHMTGVWALAFSSDDKLLASADRAGRLRVWDVQNGKLLQEDSLNSDPIWSLAFADSDDTLLVGAQSGVLRYSILEKKWAERLSTTQGQLTRVFLSANQKRLVVSDSLGHIQLIDVESEEIILKLQADNDTVWSVALSPDGETLAAATGSEIVSLYHASSGERFARLTGHEGGATNVGFLGDGATLVASDRKGRLHWWDTASARRLSIPIRAHKRSIWRMEVHPDGNSVVTTGDDGVIKLWNVLDTDRACNIGLPGFDMARRQQYLGDDRAFLACSF